MKARFFYTREEVQNIFRDSDGDNASEFSTDPSYAGIYNPNIQYLSITNSSLEVEKGSLFIPLIAERDGHEFIPDALERGAAGFLCQESHPILKKLTSKDKSLAILVKDTWHALGKIGNWHRSKFNPHIIAITGSSGKTTTKELFRAGLSSLSDNSLVITEKNYNNEIGLPFTLLNITKDTKIAVLEMGMNHRGEIERLSKMANPHTTFITTIGSAHIENLGSPEEIAREKSDIVKGSLMNANTALSVAYKPCLYLPEDIAFKDIVEENAKNSQVRVVYWELLGSSQDSKYKIIHKDYMGYRIDWDGIKWNWNLPGDKILSNLIGVINALVDLGFDISMVLSGLDSYKPEGNRLKREEGDYFTIINDTYNANPESMQSSISITKQMSNDKPFLCILGDMKELGKFSEFYHRQIGEYLAKEKCPYLITWGGESKWIGESYREYSKEENLSSVHFSVDELDNLVEWVYKNIPLGSLILCKGSRTMKMESIVEKILAHRK